MRLRTLLSNAYNRGLQLTIEKDKLNKEIHNFCDKFLIDSFEIVNLDWLHLQFLYDQLPITKYFHSLRIFLMDFFDSSYYYNNSNCMIILGEPSFGNQSLLVMFSFLQSLFFYLGSMELSYITSDVINNVALKIIQQFRTSKDESIQQYIKKYDTILKTFNLEKEQVTYFKSFEMVSDYSFKCYQTIQFRGNNR